MENIFNKAIIITLLLFAASCSNEFLDENLDTSVVSAGESAIYISPDWEAGDFQFYLPNMGNANFKIESAPSWLQINSRSGKLVNSMATIHCSATKNSDFDKMGIYLDKMKVSANGKVFYVPVYYITEGQPKIQVEKKQPISIDSYNYLYLQFQNTGAGILVWEVVSLPGWLSVDMDMIRKVNPLGPIIPQNSPAQLPLILNMNPDFDKSLTGIIILKTNDKSNPIVEINVSLDLGNPEISFLYSSKKIDFGATATTYTADIDAWGSGLLVWHFEELPDWLTVTPSKGIYRTHTYYGDVKFTCDRSKLQPGVNTAVIYLKSNAYNNTSMAITVTARAPGNNANIRALEGNVIDVTFDKNTNTLYYVTSQPDKLVAYDVINRAVLHEFQLGTTPTCLAVSEDCTKAAIGHDGQISAVNLVSWSATNINVGATIFDIAWGEGDWFCYTIKRSDYYSLNWINTNNSETSKGTDYKLYGSDIIKKVPSQPYIVATRPHIYPRGFIVYSSSAKNLKSYAHMSLSDFWFSQDGQYTFSAYGDVYRTSNATDSNGSFDISPIGRLQGSPISYFSPGCIEHSSSAHHIWAVSYSGDSNIYQFDDQNFIFQKSYLYSDVYQPDAQSAVYEVDAKYVFSNKTGTELSVMRKGRNNSNWSIEFIQVTQ